MNIQIIIFISSLTAIINGFDLPPIRDRSACKFNERCKPFLDCLSAVRNFRESGVRPTICSFKDRVPMVCCPQVRTDPVDHVNILPDQCGHINRRQTVLFRLQERRSEIDKILLQLSDTKTEKKGRSSLNRRTRQAVNIPASFTAQFHTRPQVVGGTEVFKNSYPWMAALGSQFSNQETSWFCGGSLIANKWILTAAHCLEDPRRFPLDIVRLGAHDMSDSSEDVDDYVPDNIFIHPDYDNSQALPVHDIALVKLQTAARGVQLRPTVGPVCLEESRSQLSPGSPVLVTGWGATQEGGLVADALQEVTIQVTDQDRCSRIYRESLGLSPDIGNHTLCAGVAEGGKDACQGDSGGPLVSEISQGVYKLVGIVSAGIGCARRDVPGLYARVATHRRWIEKVITENIN